MTLRFTADKSSFSRYAFPALLVAAAIFTTGCANMVTTAPATNPSSVNGTMSGHIHGGNQPVGGSTVKLYAVGLTGYGSPGTLLATTTSATDGSASFAFQQVASGGTGPTGSSYTCPTMTRELYIIASGGNTLGTGTNNNSAAVFLTAVGPCGGAANLFLDINEVTTVATTWALAQYINPGTTPGTESIGRPATETGGIPNAFATVNNLADLSHGSANVTTTQVAGPISTATVAGATVTVTPETLKINTIADILAACVNNASASAANCTTLFTNALPPAQSLTSQPTATFPTTAVDTLQAAYFMATNPTSGGSANVANLFALQAAAGAPFQDALATAPTDWTIGIKYNSTSPCTGTGAAGTFIFYPYLVEADGHGNIWIASNATNSGATPIPANLSEISPTGVPLACTLGATMSQIEGLTIDTNNNVWIAGHGAGGIQEVDPSTLAATVWTESTFTPWAMTADGSGNVFYTSASSAVHEFAGAATATMAAPSTLIGNVSTGANPNFMTVDSLSRVYVSETSGTGGLYQFYPDTNAGDNPVGGYASANIATAAKSGNVQGVIAVDASNNVWLSETTSANSVTKVVPSATNGAAATTTSSTAKAGGLNSPRGVAIDGAGNVWAPNGVANAPGQSISEFSNAGVALSGTNGYAKATTSDQGNSFFSNTLRGITIDGSGNVWAGTNNTTGTAIYELVGAAVPVTTPLSGALKAEAPVTTVKPTEQK